MNMKDGKITKNTQPRTLIQKPNCSSKGQFGCFHSSASTIKLPIDSLVNVTEEGRDKSSCGQSEY